MRFEIAFFLGVAAFAAPITVPYDVPHNFNFSPQGDVLSAQWRYSVFASATQPPVRDFKQGSLAVPPLFNQKDATATATGANADAHASINVTNFVNNNVTGTIRSWGQATVDPAVASNAEAFASSTSFFSVRGGTKMKNGNIKWGPTFQSQVHGQATAGVHDPIDFTLFDLDTNMLLADTLLTIDMNLGEGDFDWSGSSIDVDATEMDLHIKMDSPYVVEKGVLDFVIHGGVVTQSNATGIFAGLFPSVGSNGKFTSALGELSLDYNLGDFNGDALDITFDFGNGGSAAAGVPEPSTYYVTGLVLLLLGNGSRLRRIRARV